MDGEWIKATAWDGGGDCVEMRRHGDALEVCDSTDPEGRVLRFTPSEFAAWLDGAGRREFDHLLEG